MGSHLSNQSNINLYFDINIDEVILNSNEEDEIIVFDTKKEQNSEKINNKKKVVKQIDIVIPTKENVSIINSYNIIKLKIVCRYYKLKVCGKKDELIERIYNYFNQRDSVKIIERVYKKYLYTKYKNLRGPAVFNRKLCVNDTDFFTTENISEIPYSQFFSFKCRDDKVYGFNIISIYNLLFTHCETLNPYTRNLINKTVFKKIKKIIKLSKLLNEKLNIKEEEYDDDDEILKTLITPERQFISNCTSLFQYIDNLGNYTDAKWFIDLNLLQMTKFLHELQDIWFYRSQLSQMKRIEICPPNGNPFVNVPINVFRQNFSLLDLKNILLNVIELLVKSTRVQSDQLLGSNYVLCALTLVSQDAAHAIPWLYESVAH